MLWFAKKYQRNTFNRQSDLISDKSEILKSVKLASRDLKQNSSHLVQSSVLSIGTPSVVKMFKTFPIVIMTYVLFKVEGSQPTENPAI